METTGQENSKPEISQKMMLLPYAALMLSSVVPMTAFMYSYMMSGIAVEPIVHMTLGRINLLSPVAGLVLALISLCLGKKQSGHGVRLSLAGLVLACLFCIKLPKNLDWLF